MQATEDDISHDTKNIKNDKENKNKEKIVNNDGHKEKNSSNAQNEKKQSDQPIKVQLHKIGASQQPFT